MNSARFPRGLLALVLSLFATAAGATTWNSQVTYYVQVHFSKIAFDKSVRSVVAHLGVLSQVGPSDADSGRSLYWADVRDVELKDSGAHFAGQVQLQGKDRRFGPYIKSPVVQYFVQFEDGSSWISEVFAIPLTHSETVYNSLDFNTRQADYEDVFSNLGDPDIEATAAWELKFTQLG